MDHIKKIMATDAGIGVLMMRVPLGIVLAAHGAQKLFGWFGGYGLEGVGGWFDSIGLSPGLYLAALAGSAEFFGGLMMIFGFMTRLGAAAAGFTMLVAIVVVHMSSGLFLPDGVEFALVLMAACLCLVFEGGGTFSVDQALAANLNGTGVLVDSE